MVPAVTGWGSIIAGVTAPHESTSLDGRRAVLEQTLADPPVVHPMNRDDPSVLGVWRTDDSAYRLLAAHVGPGTATLETGCGLSTILFTALGAEHVCCTPGETERDRLLEHCHTRGIDASGLRFEIESSHESLPRLAAEGHEIDVFLIDGGHGFPLPMIDWFYGSTMLRRGGLLVVDDVNLAAVRQLVEFLDRDPRWSAVDGTEKWRAYRRMSSGSLAEDWYEQPFNISRTDRARRTAKRWTRRAGRLLGRITP